MPGVGPPWPDAQAKTGPTAPPSKTRTRTLGRLLPKRLGKRELRRRAWHMAPGLLPFVDWPIAAWHPMPKLLIGVAASLIVAIGIAIYVGFCRIQRLGEQKRDCIAAVAGYAGSVLVMLLLFPAQPQMAFAVLAILAFGDGSAAFGGLLLGGAKLPWNAKKTALGTACFVVIGSLMAAVVYWSQANVHLLPGHAAVTLGVAFLCAFPAAVLAAFVESLPWRLNDNIRVGIAASLAVTAAQWLLVGF
jgi:dolichol kinase